MTKQTIVFLRNIISFITLFVCTDMIQAEPVMFVNKKAIENGAPWGHALPGIRLTATLETTATHSKMGAFFSQINPTNSFLFIEK